MRNAQTGNLQVPSLRPLAEVVRFLRHLNIRRVAQTTLQSIEALSDLQDAARSDVSDASSKLEHLHSEEIIQRPIPWEAKNKFGSTHGTARSRCKSESVI